jgi:hypothetical protein
MPFRIVPWESACVHESDARTCEPQGMADRRGIDPSQFALGTGAEGYTCAGRPAQMSDLTGLECGISDGRCPFAAGFGWRGGRTA